MPEFHLSDRAARSSARKALCRPAIGRRHSGIAVPPRDDGRKTIGVRMERAGRWRRLPRHPVQSAVSDMVDPGRAVGTTGVIARDHLEGRIWSTGSLVPAPGSDGIEFPPRTTTAPWLAARRSLATSYSKRSALDIVIVVRPLPLLDVVEGSRPVLEIGPSEV